MRSFVSEPMQHGRLFLCGRRRAHRAATGAKGLNLAVHDVKTLAAALTRWFASNDASSLDRYTDDCLPRIWRAEDFSMFMTRLLHRPDDAFERRTQLARLRYVCSSEAAQRSLAGELRRTVRRGADDVHVTDGAGPGVGRYADRPRHPHDLPP